MSYVNVHEAKTHFSRLLARAQAGEEVIIAKAGKPVARLVAIEPVSTPPRVPGRLKGLIKYDDASFFEPLPEEELRLWEGR